jgi:paraquat-inducible protein B
LTDNIPEAIVTKKSRFSVVWLIPLVALMIGGWLTFKYLYEKGVSIQIEFSSANGLAAGKTKIKYKDVEIGVVDDISFGPELANVIVTATLDKDMRKHLNDKTRFWVVRARVAAGEVSGLGTLLSGAYIGMEPGDGEKKQRSFRGLDKPPVLLTEDHGSRYMLSSETLHSFDAGAPVYYRRLKVGEVIRYKLNEKGTRFDIEVFVKTPYDQLVNENTLFWNASGIDVKLGTEGFELHSESMLALLLGGLAFDNLEKESGPQAKSGTSFELYKNREAATSIEYKRSDKQYRLYFDGSARGLNVGAPVTLRGIKLGHVTDVKLEYDMRDMSFKIPVTIEFEPDRLEIIGKESADDEPPSTEDLVKHGLRAQLRSGNILTGQMIIDFDVYPDAEPAEVRHEGEYMVLPTVSTSMESIKNSLSDIMEKIGKMPLDEIGVNLNGVLEGINTMVHSNDVKEILTNINEATAQLNDTLAQTEAVAAGLSEDSDAYQELVRTMHELSGAARSLRQMAEYLERHPEALLKGKPK